MALVLQFQLPVKVSALAGVHSILTVQKLAQRYASKSWGSYN